MTGGGGGGGISPFSEEVARGELAGDILPELSRFICSRLFDSTRTMLGCVARPVGDCLTLSDALAAVPLIVVPLATRDTRPCCCNSRNVCCGYF